MAEAAVAGDAAPAEGGSVSVLTLHFASQLPC